MMLLTIVSFVSVSYASNAWLGAWLHQEPVDPEFPFSQVQREVMWVQDDANLQRSYQMGQHHLTNDYTYQLDGDTFSLKNDKGEYTGTFTATEKELELCFDGGDCAKYEKLKSDPVFNRGAHPVPNARIRLKWKDPTQELGQLLTEDESRGVFPEDYEDPLPLWTDLYFPRESDTDPIYNITLYVYLVGEDPLAPSSYWMSAVLWKQETEDSEPIRLADVGYAQSLEKPLKLEVKDGKSLLQFELSVEP